jgi:hypothetical protein
MTRRAPGRATRQILSGAELAPDPNTIAGRDVTRERISPTLAFFLVLSALVLAAAIVWAIWGMGPATPIVVLLALGLIAAWIVL